MTPSALFLPAVFAVVAIVYAAVGQAGGTGYIAAMGLLGYSPKSSSRPRLRSIFWSPRFVGALLILAAILMMRSARTAALSDQHAPHAPPFFQSLLAGGVVGFASGVTGVGGGIFLAPLVLKRGKRPQCPPCSIS